MTERKLTDEEIVKALENCSDGTDKGIIRATLDLINRQNAEIERLRNTVKTDFLTVTEKLKFSQSEIGDIRTEAIKEFADRLRKYYDPYDDYDDIYAHNIRDDIDFLLKEMTERQS